MSEGAPVTNTTGFPTTQEPTILPKQPEFFGGCRVFDVDGGEYFNLIKRVHKWDRWKKYFDTENMDSNCHNVKEYLYRNPNKTVVLRNMTTQEMIYFKPKHKTKNI